MSSIKGGGSFIVCLAISFSSSSESLKGNFPTNNKYVKMPILQISTLLSYFFPHKTSGATYDTVPKGCSLFSCGPRIMPSPKSINLILKFFEVLVDVLIKYFLV